MTDRLANIVTGLQRLAENARIKGDDIRSAQKWEDEQYASEIRQLLNMVEKVRASLLEDLTRFTTPQNPTVGQAARGTTLEDQRAAMAKALSGSTHRVV
jgi:hypothetical protein